MVQLVKTLLTAISKLLGSRNYVKRGLPHLWYGTNNTQPTSEEELKQILMAKFPNAKVIQVEDSSGGCGAMYNVYVETSDFKGISIPKQHQAVYAALHEKIKLIHGLHLVTKVPP